MLTARRFFAGLAIGITLLVTACKGPTQAGNAVENVENKTVPTVPLPPFPLPAAPLSREQLLLAVEHAASDFVAGIDDQSRQKQLADSKFEFRIRFGCEGPQAKDTKSVAGWSVNPATHALRMHAKPTLSKSDPPVATIADDDFEAVEGFWVDRPWLLQAVCPRSTVSEATDAEPSKSGKSLAKAPQAVPQIVGIAQFFTATDPRTMRRDGRSYEATTKLDDGDQPAGGFDLLLSGRLKALPDGRVIACTPTAAGQRPACIVSVEFGQVSIERADTHESLADWGNG
jgi:hypothetical protein